MLLHCDNFLVYIFYLTVLLFFTCSSHIFGSSNAPKPFFKKKVSSLLKFQIAFVPRLIFTYLIVCEYVCKYVSRRKEVLFSVYNLCNFLASFRYNHSIFIHSCFRLIKIEIIIFFNSPCSPTQIFKSVISQIRTGNSSVKDIHIFQCLFE